MKVSVIHSLQLTVFPTSMATNRPCYAVLHRAYSTAFSGTKFTERFLLSLPFLLRRKPTFDVFPCNLRVGCGNVFAVSLYKCGIFSSKRSFTFSVDYLRDLLKRQRKFVIYAKKNSTAIIDGDFIALRFV